MRAQSVDFYRRRRALVAFAIAAIGHAAIAWKGYVPPGPVALAVLSATALWAGGRGVGWIRGCKLVALVGALLNSAIVVGALAFNPGFALVGIGAGGTAAFWRFWYWAREAPRSREECAAQPSAARSPQTSRMWSELATAYILFASMLIPAVLWLRARPGYDCEQKEGAAPALAALVIHSSNAYGIYANHECIMSVHSQLSHASFYNCWGSVGESQVTASIFLQQVVRDPNRHRFFSSELNRGAWWTLEPSGAARHTVENARSLIGLDVWQNGRKLVLIDERRNALLIVDVSKGTLERTIELGLGVGYDVAVDERRNLAVVTDWIGPFLYQVQLDTGAVSRRFTGFSALGVAMDSASGLAYVAYPLSSRVVAYDVETLSPVRAYDASYGVRSIALETKAGVLVAANYFDGSVDWISLADNRNLLHLPVGPLVRAVTLHPGTLDAYVGWRCGVSRVSGPIL